MSSSRVSKRFEGKKLSFLINPFGFFFFQCFTSMGNEECSMGFFLKLLPSAAIINGEKNRNAARRNKVFQREVNVTFGILPQIQKAALTKGLSLAIPEIVYGSHDTKVRI